MSVKQHLTVAQSHMEFITDFIADEIFPTFDGDMDAVVGMTKAFIDDYIETIEEEEGIHIAEGARVLMYALAEKFIDGLAEF